MTVLPSMLRSWLPFSSFCFIAATRTMKNSSRFELTMETNFTRSSKLVCGIARFFEHAPLELQQAEFAVHVQRRVVERYSGSGVAASLGDLRLRYGSFLRLRRHGFAVVLSIRLRGFVFSTCDVFMRPESSLSAEEES